MSVSSDKEGPRKSNGVNSSFDLAGEMIKMEVCLINKILIKHNGNLEQTAEALGVSMDYLKSKIYQYDIEA